MKRRTYAAARRAHIVRVRLANGGDEDRGVADEEEVYLSDEEEQPVHESTSSSMLLQRRQQSPRVVVAPVLEPEGRPAQLAVPINGPALPPAGTTPVPASSLSLLPAPPLETDVTKL